MSILAAFFSRIFVTPKVTKKIKAENTPSKYGDPHKDLTSLGNIAISKAYISHTDLTEALTVQALEIDSEGHLGRILLEMGRLTREQLHELLFEQKVLRGEVKDKRDIIKFEKLKKTRRVKAVGSCFDAMGASAEELASTIRIGTSELKENVS